MLCYAFLPAPQSAIPVARALFFSKYIRTGIIHGRLMRPNPIPIDKYNKDSKVIKSMSIRVDAVKSKYFKVVLAKIPVTTPTEMYKNKILFAAALIPNPIADKTAPLIVTVLKPYLFINALATGPAPVDMP